MYESLVGTLVIVTSLNGQRAPFIIQVVSINVNSGDASHSTAMLAEACNGKIRYFDVYAKGFADWIRDLEADANQNIIVLRP